MCMHSFSFLMKRASTFFLKAVLIIIALGMLVFAFFAFPSIWKGVVVEWPALTVTYFLYPGLIAIFTTAVPFLFALFQAFKLLQYIDTNNAFSALSIRALRTIKYSAISMTVLYALAMPLIFLVAELDDAPGLILIYSAFACAPLVVATFAAVLQKLVQHAIDLKSENELTI
jgi:hypothetical protein